MVGAVVKRRACSVVLSAVGAFAVWALGLLVLAGAVVPSCAWASSNPSYDAAYAHCMAYNDPASKEHFSPDPEEFDHCGLRTDVTVNRVYFFIRCMANRPTCTHGVIPITYWGFTGTPPGPCEDKPDLRGSVEVDGFGTARACDGTCEYAMVDGEQTSNEFGNSLMVGTWRATQNTCSTGPTPGLGSTPPTTTPPKLCGGGSCYDTPTDTFCAVDSSGQQVCISGPDARKPGGGCESTGAATVCAGSPPPKPPAPPASPISDPPSEITGSDKFVTTTVTPPAAGSPPGTPPTSTNSTTTVNTYAPGGQAQNPTNSGQAEGDKGPASSSSTGGNGDEHGSASGGGDCNTPPICSGDAPTCMVVSQTWLNRCKRDYYDLDGDGVPDWVGDASQLEGIPLINGSDPIGGNGTVTSDAVVSTDHVSIDSISSESWAGNTCPQLPNLTFFDREITYGDQALFCDWLAKLRPIFLLVCGFIAMRILASGGKS